MSGQSHQVLYSQHPQPHWLPLSSQWVWREVFSYEARLLVMCSNGLRRELVQALLLQRAVFVSFRKHSPRGPAAVFALHHRPKSWRGYEVQLRDQQLLSTEGRLCGCLSSHPTHGPRGLWGSRGKSTSCLLWLPGSTPPLSDPLS